MPPVVSQRPVCQPLAVIVLLAGALGFGGTGCRDAGSRNRWELLSPDGRLRVELMLDDESGTLGYSLARDDRILLEPGPLGITTGQGAFVRGLRPVDATRRRVDESYRLPAGKRRERTVAGRELVLLLENAVGGRMELVVRAHDDGMAYRYRVAGIAGAGVRSEESGFSVPQGAQGFLLPYDLEGLLFFGTYEMAPARVSAGTATTSSGWAYPALFELPGGQDFLLITEADLDKGYCGTRLAPEPEGTLYRVRFPAEREGNGIGPVEPVVADDLVTPWRVVLAGDAATLVSSTLVDDLSRPGPQEDTSWIRPGRAAWSWLTQGTGDPALQRDYIEFAAGLGWEYVLVDAEWDQWPEAEEAMAALAAEAGAAGVGLLLWYNSGGTHTLNEISPRDRMLDPEVRRAEMEKIAAWGVAGIKVDFFESDKQDRIRQYLDILEDAADHHLLVNFHGATVPRGWQRTHPHLMAHEAVRGAEYFRLPEVAGRPGADTHLWNVFARNVVGSMDYTPVVFEDALREGELPYAHSLAQAVLFESGLQHFADQADHQLHKGYRAVFADHPWLRDLLADVPVAWDDTRLLEGHPGTHAVLARRSGTTWWIAAIAGTDVTIDAAIPLAFLEEGPHDLELVAEGQEPDDLVRTVRTVQPGSTLALSLTPRTGVLARLTPAGDGRAGAHRIELLDK